MISVKILNYIYFRMDFGLTTLEMTWYFITAQPDIVSVMLIKTMTAYQFIQWAMKVCSVFVKDKVNIVCMHFLMHADGWYIASYINFEEYVYCNYSSSAKLASSRFYGVVICTLYYEPTRMMSAIKLISTIILD